MPFQRKMSRTVKATNQNKQPLPFRILFYANRLGAIGKRQLFRQTIKATSIQMATLALYEKYDHITIKSIR